jgi:taurine transport system substrate-binding protein
LRKSKSLWLCLVLVVVLVVSAGCGKPATPPAPPGEEGMATVVYGGSSWLGHYPAMVGIEKGFFAEENVRVIFQGFYTSSGRMGSMAAGQLDFAATGSISALALAAADNKSFYMVATPDSYATVEGIIARKDIAGVSDLKGKKLAVTFASSAHVLVYDILEQYNLDPETDVELINMTVNDMVTAMQTGEIDAAAAWTPAFERLLALDNTHLLVNDESFSLYKEYKLGPGPDVLAFNRKFVDENPELTTRVLRGYFKAIDFMISNPDESAAIIADYTGLPLETQKATLAEIEWYTLAQQHEFMVDPGTFITGLKMLSEFLVRHNILDKAPAVEEWIRTDILPK